MVVGAYNSQVAVVITLLSPFDVVYVTNRCIPPTLKTRYFPKFSSYFFCKMVTVFSSLPRFLAQSSVLVAFTRGAAKFCVSTFRCKFFAAYLAFLGGGFSFAVVISSRTLSTTKITLLSIVVRQSNLDRLIAFFTFFFDSCFHMFYQNQTMYSSDKQSTGKIS